MRIRAAESADLGSLCALMEDLMGQEMPRAGLRQRLGVLRRDASERLDVCEEAAHGF